MIRFAFFMAMGISFLNLPLLAGARVLGASLSAPQVFYSQSARGYPHLYVMDVERSLSQLFMRHTDPYSLAWSPDGDQIALASDPNGRGLEIFVAGAYGPARRITSEETNNYAPYWTPGGQIILFARADLVVPMSWAAVELASGLVRPHPINQVIDSQTERAWSPDGRQVAFVMRRQETMLNEILLGNAECLSALTPCAEPLRRLRPGPSVRYGIAGLRWSPDGRSLAFSAFSSGTDNRDIYVIDTYATGAQRVTSHPAVEIAPAWSPDGRRLAFLSNRDDTLQLYTVDLGCLPHSCEPNLRQITSGEALNLEPAWSPDGQMIAFVSDRDGNYEIYVVNADGSHTRRLTVDPEKNEAPRWRP